MQQFTFFILTTLLFLCVGIMPANSQMTIKGILKDIANDEPIQSVSIKNVNNGTIIYTTSDGLFSMDVKKNDLIEIHHMSYETIRLRIKDDKKSLYYNLVMRPKTNRLMEIIVRDKNTSYAADSVRSYETYKLILEKPGVDEMSASTAPMAMMSNKFRQEQAFKENYQKWEKAKYVNYMFNPKQLQKWTGLTGDSLALFIDTYRPSYEFIRGANDYQYLLYIKNSLGEFCTYCVFRRK
jgi:ASC-1-like (ASCH) protein